MDLWQRAATRSHFPRKFQARGLQVAASGPKATPLIEGSLEVKLPTIWTDEKQRWEESEKRREEKNKEDPKEKVQKIEDAGARKGRKVARHSVFVKNCTPLWREAHVQVKMYKTPQPRNTFGS